MKSKRVGQIVEMLWEVVECPVFQSPQMEGSEELFSHDLSTLIVDNIHLPTAYGTGHFILGTNHFQFVTQLGSG